MSDSPGANVRCRTCGLETSHPEFFHKQRRSFRTRVDYYCPQCWAQRLTRARHHKIRWWALLSIGGLLLTWLRPENVFGWALLNFAWIEACAVLTVIPHEFAHAFAARALGLRVFRIIIGSGSTWWRGPVVGFEVEAKTFPFDGVVVAAHRELRGIRWKQFLFVLAGPMANLLLIAIALAALGSRPWWISPFSTQWAGWQLFAFTNLIVVLTNLWPHHVQTALGPLASDGRLLIDTLLERGSSPEQYHAGWFRLEALNCAEQRRPDEARAWIERGLALYPDDELLLQHHASLLINAGELETARNLLLPLLARPALQDAARLGLMNDIAYVDALIGRNDLFEEADRYSAEALAAFPWIPALQNTRGAVLLTLGHLEEALPLLRASSATAREVPEHQAQCQSVLAIAEARAGDVAAAERALTAARTAAADCFLISRAEAAVQAARERLAE